MTGRVFDTYVAALQHDHADVPDDAGRVGVVRRPTSWLHGVVEENFPALGPPDELLDAVSSKREHLEASGVEDTAAHNRAMDAVDFDERYLDHLHQSPAAVAAFGTLVGRLAAGEDVVLVCYENTADKRCHRTLLRRRLVEESGE